MDHIECRENVELCWCKYSCATENSSTLWYFHPWHLVCIFFSVGNLWGDIILWYGDNLTDRPTAFIPSPHYQHGIGVSATHMLGFLLIRSEMWYAVFCMKNMLSHKLRRILYLQSLHARLRWGRCLVGCPPDLCVQPEKVRLWGRCECSAAQTQARDTSRVNRQDSDRQHDWWRAKERGTDSPSSSVPVVPKVFSLLLEVRLCWSGRHH